MGNRFLSFSLSWNTLNDLKLDKKIIFLINDINDD